MNETDTITTIMFCLVHCVIGCLDQFLTSPTMQALKRYSDAGCDRDGDQGRVSDRG